MYLIIEMRKCEGNVWGNWFPITYENQMTKSELADYLVTCERQKGSDTNKEYRMVVKKD